MKVTRQDDLPDGSFLSALGRETGCHTDGFFVDLPSTISLPRFVKAFYTSWLFRLERGLLRLAGMSSADDEIAGLFDGTTKVFAAWSVAERSADQILLRDRAGATYSWFRVETRAEGSRVWFGSAVMNRPGESRPNWVLRALMPCHLAYARMLLGAAVRRL